VSKNNHIAGYMDNYNFNQKGIKWTEVGDAGATKLISEKSYIGEGGNVLMSDKLSNEFVSIYLSGIIPKYTQGSTMLHAKWPYFKDVLVEIPSNHKELSKKIKKINNWEKLTIETTQKMGTYINGILQYSLGKGE
jgi:hypothetical protein